jgi:hypothetical protein
LNTYRCYRLYLEIVEQVHCSLQISMNLSAISKFLILFYKKSRETSIWSPYLSLERLNHREYKDAFLLQDINIKMHKIMVLMCSATLNRLQIKRKRSLVIKIQKTGNLHAGHTFTSTLKESYTDNSSSSSVSVLHRHQFSGICWFFIYIVWWRCTSNKAEICQNRRWKGKLLWNMWG